MLQNDYQKDIAVSIATNLRNISALMPAFEQVADLDASDQARIRGMLNSIREVEEIVKQRINQYYRDQSIERHYNPQK